jgi:TetR/AcrR family tetracycline transcriptional repressor
MTGPPARGTEGAAAPFHRGLSRERITDAALAIVGERGLPGLTMRRLAASLRVDPAALYRHVRNKDDLLGLLADVLLDRLDEVPDATEADWRASVSKLMHQLRELLRDQPGLAAVVTGGPLTPGSARFTARALGSLRAAGMVDEHDALSVLLAYVVGFAALEDGDAGMPHPVPPAAASTDTALATAFWAPEPAEADRRFHRGLDLILDTLTTAAPRTDHGDARGDARACLPDEPRHRTVM